MALIPQFAKYAAAFEDAFRTDDWTPIAPFFTEDAVYEAGLPEPFGGRFEGRDAVIAYFRNVLDGFDRRFATRELVLRGGPRETADSVWIRGGVRYTAPGVPDLYFELEETVRFRGDQICALEDRYEPDAIAAIEAYVTAHAEALGLAVT